MRLAVFLGSYLFALTMAANEPMLPIYPVTENNPFGKVYESNFSKQMFNTDVKGFVTARAGRYGKGVNISVNIYGFKKVTGPFSWHIHEFEVPADGDCTKTGKHLNYLDRPVEPPCDTTKPETCEPGDMAGKHGKVPKAKKPGKSTGLRIKFHDPYISIKKGDPAFIGGRSIVFHLSDENKTRYACANIVCRG